MSRCPHCGETHGADNHFCPVTGKAIDLGPRLVGQTLLDHFRVITILGEGPTGIVLEVEDLRNRARLAAKLIHPQHTRAGNTADLLLNEAKMSGQLGCHNIARVIEVGRDTGAAPVVVRELMIGECLEDHMDEHEQLHLGEAVGITKDILTALMAIHEVGILNLDLSPADVFLDVSSGPRVTKLVDFGEGHVKPGLTLDSGEEPESHKYYAPEQRRKGFKGDARADVFAAGAIMYHMVTGKEPARIPAPANSLRKEIAPKLAAVIHKALAASPDNRYQKSADFMAALNDAAQGIAPPQPAPKPVAGAVPVAPPAPAPVAPAAPAAPAPPAPPPPAAPAPPVPAPAPPSAPAAPETTGPIIEQSTVQYQEPTGTDEELAQPSVIVDMPEVATAGSKKGVVIAVVIVALLAIVGGILFFTMGGDGDEPDDQVPAAPQMVTITIDVTPKTAVVSIDGKRVDGDPPSAEVEAGKVLHSVRAKAEGYEPLEKDIKFDETKTINMVLEEVMETVEPEGGDEKEEAIVEEIVEEELPPTPEPVVAEPDPEPEPEVVTPKPAATKKPPVKKPTAKKPPVKKPPAKKPPVKKPPVEKPAEKSKKSGKKKGGFDTANPYG